MADLVGTQLGHYHLLRLLGKGGMAEVYLAHDEAEHEVAVKVVSGTNEDYLERFMREVATIDKLTHDHILPAYDYDSEGPWHYLVMLYAPHGTLSNLLDHGPLPLDEALEILEQVADALQFAHDYGIIHRDIKPSNILLRDAHYVYLADFGLAKSVEGSGHLTQTGILLGTPEYMAPDLSEGPASISSDIYALGIVLYQMVTGRLPFVAETPLAVYWKQIREQPSAPSQHHPDLPPAIDAVILRALKKNPRLRFQSVRELVEAFRMAVQDPEWYLAQERKRLRLESRASTRSTTPRALQRSLRNRRSPSPRRQVLPEQSASAPVEVAIKERPAPSHTPSMELPPLPIRRRKIAATSDPETPYPVQPVARRRRRTEQPHRTATVVSIVALGFLLLVGLPMTYIYYAYETSHTTTASLANATQLLQATEQAQQQQATATASVAATVSTGSPILADSLSANTPGRWAEDATHCTFRGGSYHVQVQQTNFLQSCPLLGRFIDNAAIQAEVSLLSGSNAGMLLRLQAQRFYDFEINNQGQFFFRRHDTGGGSTYTSLIAPTASKAILPGGLKNTLLVLANGADFKLYINGTFVGEVQDSTYASGQIALVAGTLAPLNGGEGSFTNFKISRLA
jgi:serine/threonine protein kinase